MSQLAQRRQDLIEMFRREHSPAGPIENFLVEQMAHATWRLEIIARYVVPLPEKYKSGAVKMYNQAVKKLAKEKALRAKRMHREFMAVKPVTELIQ